MVLGRLKGSDGLQNLMVVRVRSHLRLTNNMSRKNLPLQGHHVIQERLTHTVVGWRSLTNHMSRSQCPLSSNHTFYNAMVRYDQIINWAIFANMGNLGNWVVGSPKVQSGLWPILEGAKELLLEYASEMHPNLIVGLFCLINYTRGSISPQRRATPPSDNPNVQLREARDGSRGKADVPH